MNNELLRHIVSTIAYRLAKTTTVAPPDFETYSAGPGCRTPVELLCHMTQVILMTRNFVAENRFEPRVLDSVPWAEEVIRFDHALRDLDSTLVSEELPTGFAKRIIQGPLSDVLTHVGQLAMLCGLAGVKIPGEDYSVASINTGL